jgi:2-polyprenyl-6-methoxyphenol hydroxylase-like FAD-dependent oxidoreductase
LSIDFLIVGGGIGGAVLANLLSRHGKRVLVMEKNLAPVPQNRPEILWPATVRVLRSLIPSHLEERWMLLIRAGQVYYKRQMLLHFNNDVFEKAGVHLCSTANTRELLLQQANCEVRRGVEVTAVLRSPQRVLGVRTRDTATGAEQEVLAEWTVGDDGVQSVMRRGCGLTMTMRFFPLELLSFAFDWPADVPHDMVRLWINENRLDSGVLLMGTIPLPQGRGAGLLPVWPDRFANERHLQKAIRAFVAHDPQLAAVVQDRTYPHGMQRIRVGWGRTPHFGVAGAILMGDAAHPVTPAGGQGANASVADALVLADVASERPAQLLSEYTQRRWPATQRSLSISRTASKVFATPRPLLNLGLWMFPWAVRWMNRHLDTFGGFLRTAAGAFQEHPLDASARTATAP